MTRPKPVVLCILDGWGESDVHEHNAIAQAHTPHWDHLRATYPFGTLNASEGDVGLPTGQMGNSEVGHMNIGAGRIVMQELPRIDKTIIDGTLAKNAALQTYIAALQKSGGTCHLLGLISDGGVHAHQSHVIALAKIVAAAGVPVAIHAFLDGRDTAPQSARTYMAQLDAAIAGKSITIATVSGRYYAMDRDKRWDRVTKAYNAMADANAPTASRWQDVVDAGYAAGTTDEFILPTAIGDYAGMRDGDGLLMANYRADRARQLLHTFVDTTFDGFPRPRTIHFAATLGMVEYSAALAAFMPAIFHAQTLANNLGEIVARAGLTQLRIAETEKYAHVTFFFNGGREEPFAGEQRMLVPSPNVATYDLQPEMSAPEVTDKLVAAINANSFDFIVVNYANTDMVGHSGNIDAAIKAVEAIDACMGRLSHAVEHAGGAMLVTADHGNVECLHDDESNQPHTAHTLNVVPCLLVGPMFRDAPKQVPTGILADIAPTLCALLELPQPAEMTGRNLLAASTHAPL